MVNNIRVTTQTIHLFLLLNRAQLKWVKAIGMGEVPLGPRHIDGGVWKAGVCATTSAPRVAHARN
jgi:hypothetical protein